MIIKFYKIPDIFLDSENYMNMYLSHASTRLEGYKLYEFNSTAYYPSFYKDSIVLNLDQISTLDNTPNYISLNNFVGGMSNKSFTNYYYIRNIEYVNANNYKFYLEMDVITTYFFDYDIKYAQFNRKHIDRWVYEAPSTVRNKNYIRENVSEYDEYEIESITKTVPSQYYLLCKFSNEQAAWFVDLQTEIAPRFKFSDNNIITEPIMFLLIPFLNLTNANDTFTFTITNTYDPSASVTKTFNMIAHYANLRTLLSSPYVLDCCVVSDIDIGTVNIDKTNNVISQTRGETTPYPNLSTLYYMTQIISGATVDNNIYSVPVIVLNSNDYKMKFDKQVKIPFKKNTTGLQTNYSPDYEPALFDINYIEYKYGDSNYKCSIPLYELKCKSEGYLYFYNKCNFQDGARIYAIDENYQLNYDLVSNNKYNSFIISNSKEVIEMTNDAWKDYLSKNMGSLTLGLFGNMITGGLGAAITGFGPLGAALGAIASPIAKGTQLINKDFQPDTLKQGNQWFTDAHFNMFQRYLIVEKVFDFDRCGRYYQKFGNKVNTEFYKTNAHDFSQEINNRYYFNFFSLKDYTYEYNGIISNDIRNKIKEILTTGIRLWNMYNVNDLNFDYKYDNVERSVVQ